MSIADLTERLRAYGSFEYKHSSLDRARLLKEVDDRIAALESLLLDCRDELERYSDVKDGSDGRPQANRAMSLVGEIERVVGEKRE